MRTVATIAGLLLASALPESAPGQPIASSAQVRAAQGARCDAALGRLVTAASDLTLITVADRPASQAPDSKAVPRHCELIGSFDRHRAADGQAYAIRFHLRLPQAWNGRFFFQGGGGSDGVLGDALGDLQGGRPETALQLGYAVVSQDAGHDNAVNTEPAHGGAVAFGWDQRGREDYAYRSQARVTVLAKQILGAYYGRGPQFSYFVGCSKGGQEGLAMAQRFPDYFDGVVANAPGFTLPKAAIAEAWDTQAFARAANSLGAVDPEGLPLINAAFSDLDLTLVAKALLRACDQLDGAADGIIGDFAACTTRRVTPELNALTCISAKTEACLTAAQIEALKTVYGGPRDSRGQALYSDWAWDAGIGGTRDGRTYAGWRAWKLGTAGARGNDGRNVLLGGSSLTNVFLTPPTATRGDASGGLRALLAFDFDRDAPRIFQTTASYPISAWDLLNAQGDLSGFRGRGGRMIIVQGVSDPVFSIRDTARWWDGLDQASGGQAARNVRLFPAPGMNHCRGGPGATEFDAFTALTDWVEHGRAPEQILATAPADTPWPGRTRPLCAYPQSPTYDGHSDLQAAASFACRPGRRVSDDERASNLR